MPLGHEKFIFRRQNNYTGIFQGVVFIWNGTASELSGNFYNCRFVFLTVFDNMLKPNFVDQVLLK